MKKDELNMDRIIKEKLEGYSVEPPSHLWAGIQGQMAALRRKKRIAFISRIAAAAVVLLAFLAGWYFNEQSGKVTPEVTQNKSVTEQNEQVFTPENLPETEPQTEVEKSEKTNIPVKPEKEIQKPDKIWLAENQADTENSINNENTGLTERVQLNRLKYLDATVKKSDQISQTSLRKTNKIKPGLSATEKVLIADNIRTNSEVKQEEAGWKMGLNIAPAYSSHTSEYTNSYAQNMTYAGSGGETNVSGGISVQYKTKSRWSVESGVYYAKNAQASTNTPQLVAVETEGSGFDQMNSPNAGERYYFNTALQVADNKAVMNSTAGVIKFNEFPKGAEIATTPESGKTLGVADLYANSLLTSGEFSQVFDFLEVPLYMRYLLIDSNIDVELIGGVSAGLVVGNNVFMKNDGSTQNIGETRDISTLNMMGTFGFGVNYSLGKHISLGVEPRISYFLNSINNNPAVEYRPYRIGLYTGLYYDF